jgi:hypothetical protein
LWCIFSARRVHFVIRISIIASVAEFAFA